MQKKKEKEKMPEFHRNVQEMTTCFEILRKSARKIRKMLEISGIWEKFSFVLSIFIRLPRYYGFLGWGTRGSSGIAGWHRGLLRITALDLKVAREPG